MRFDPISYALGFLTSTGMSVVLWRYRTRLSAMQERAESQIEGTRRFIGRSAEGRYYSDMMVFLQRRHIAGDVVQIADVLLEPRLLAAQEIPLPPSDERETALSSHVFDVVPIFHDLPQGYTPFNIETVDLDSLGAGDRQIAILGIPGIGKSTTLTTLAMMAFGEVAFESLEHMTQEAIEKEEEGLSVQEREQRAKERAMIQERALEKLHDVHANQRQKQQAIQQTDAPPPLVIQELLPVLIDLNDLDFETVTYTKGKALDPAEPLVRAVEQQVSAVTAQIVGSVIYPALDQGKALILLDGYDELLPRARETYYYWLQQLVRVYGQNLIVITGPAEGYEPLVRLGFTPTFLRPWREQDYEQLAQRWHATWTAQQKKSDDSPPPDENTIRQIMADNRGRSMLDVTLKIWTALANDAHKTGRAGWYDAAVSRKLSQPEARERLPRLAAELLAAGEPVARAKLIETLTETMPIGVQEQKNVPKPDEILASMVRDGVLILHSGDRLSLPHSQITAYLASESLIAQPPNRLADLALDPAWHDALSFAGAFIDMLPVLQRKLSTPPDLMYDNLFGLVYWLPDAPPDAIWRGDLFKRLAAALMAPEQYPLVRERAVAALIAARDKNVLFVFRQALRAADPDTRRLACVGLGALGNPEAIKDLAPMLGDDNPKVQLAAGLALGAIGTEHALEVMIQGLVEGSEDLRRAVSETLAAIPGEGQAVLRDAIQSDDIMIRRAAVYGLSRIHEPWAVVALYRAMLEDEQWYVRSAAEEAFLDAQNPERTGPRALPEADGLVWLIEWAAGRGEGVPTGPNSRQMLVRVLQEGDPRYKSLAAATLGRLGHVQALKPLYGALRDRSPEVRGAAYSALTDIQMQVGQLLPGLL